jgi:type I restriction enzyme, R subunit
VDLSDLALTHFKIKEKGRLTGLTPDGKYPMLEPITDNALREARDREKAMLSDLVKLLNEALGKDISDTDQVALAVHVTEKLRGDKVVMAQVENNSKEQAMKANLPAAAVQAIFDAMTTHQTLATRLLSDEGARKVFVDVVYEMLRRDYASGMFGATGVN